MTDTKNEFGRVQGHPAERETPAPSPKPSTANSASVEALDNATEIVPDTNAAVAFLYRWAPEGPWTLTAIVPDGRTETRSFDPTTERECHAWIDLHQRRRNLYFSVNPPKGAITSKAKKEDIARLVALHVDIDPRVGEDIDDERHRILRLFEELTPPPSVIIDSGGGYQGFWRLQPEERLEVNGELDKVEELEAYNIQLEKLFKADPCHNIDRIMRLPGTVNVPNKRKLKKGRKPALAKLVQWHDERLYELSEFTPAVRVQTLTGGRPKVVVGGNVPRLASVEDLKEWNVSDHAMALIVQGKDPVEPAKYPSRSEVLFRVCCELVRASVPDEVIYSVITDPNFEIARSVLEKPNSQKYALRQIEQAKSAASDDPVSVVNQRYFAAMQGKRVLYYREEESGVVTPMQSEAFNFELAPLVHVEDGKKSTPYAQLWRKSSRRRYYPSGFVLDPKNECPEGTYNLWKGFGVDPAPGDWSRMRAHIEEVLADSDPALADYVIRWTAWSLQNPATPPRVALVFKGAEGVGKGVFGNALRDAFGIHGMRVQNMLQLAGRFNAHLRHCCLLFADEAMLPGSDYEGTLKGLITEPTIPIELKGVDVEQAENHLHVVMASNNDWVVPAGIGARRFAVFKVAERFKGDSGYFDRLFGELRSGGLEAMLHDLLAMDLGSWHPEAARPDTPELARQKANSLNPVERVWFDCLVQGELPSDCYEEGGDYWLLGTLPFAELVQERTKREATLNRVASFFDGQLGFKRQVTKRPKGFVVPPLIEARAIWADRFFEYEWDQCGTWGEPDHAAHGRDPF